MLLFLVQVSKRVLQDFGDAELFGFSEGVESCGNREIFVDGLAAVLGGVGIHVEREEADEAFANLGVGPDVRDAACRRNLVAILKLAENPARGGILAHSDGIGKGAAAGDTSGKIGHRNNKRR